MVLECQLLERPFRTYRKRLMAFSANHVASSGNQKVRAQELLSNYETVHDVTMAFLSIETYAVQSTGASKFSMTPSN